MEAACTYLQQPKIGTVFPYYNLSRVAAELLRDAGFDVESFSNFEELRNLLSHCELDGLIVDMDMTDADEIADQARLLNPNLPVLYISTLAERQSLDEITSVHSASHSWKDVISDLKGMLYRTENSGDLNPVKRIAAESFA